MFFKKFKYLTCDRDDVSPDDVLTRKYTNIEDLDGMLVIAIEQLCGNAKTYSYAIVQRDEFIAKLATGQMIPELSTDGLVFHEVIFGTMKQKLKFDVDISGGKLSADEVDMLLMMLDESIKTIFYQEYGHVLKNSDIITTSATGLDENNSLEGSASGEASALNRSLKYSYHKIINGYAVSGSVQAAEFTKYVMSLMPLKFKEYIDIGVNKSMQNMRLVFCHKIGSTRIKKIIGNEVNPINTLISYTNGCVTLRDLKKIDVARRDATVLTADDIDEACRIVESSGLTAYHTFRCERAGILDYDRNLPSYCEICARTHTNENSLYIVCEKSGGTCNVYEKCRRQGGIDRRILGNFALLLAADEVVRDYIIVDRNSDSNSHDDDGDAYALDIDSEPGDNDTDTDTESDAPKVIMIKEKSAACDNIVVKTPMKERLDKMIDRILTQIPERNDIGAIRTIEASGNANIYAEPTLRPFEHAAETLFVIAGMKMGKTKNLRELLRNHYVDTPLVKHSILFLSFRQTFSANIAKAFNDFTLYNDITGELRDLRMIVQIESFHRMALDPNTPKPDLIVIDESELIFEQFGSGLSKQLRTAWEKFRWFIANAKHVICMDAAMSDRSVKIMQKLRQQPIFIHHNTFQNASLDTYYITADLSSFYISLFKDLGEKKRIAVATSSFAECVTMEKVIRQRFPDLCIGMYSSETPPKKKKDDFADVDAVWTKYDVLLYTPTVSAGVSFEARNHFDKVYAWFSDKSCNVEVCLQMLGRVRDVATKTYVIGFGVVGDNLPTTYEGIVSALYRDRLDLYGTPDFNLLQFRYDATGFKRYVEDEYFALYIENIRVKNLSQNTFIRRFVALVSVYGAKIESFAKLNLDLSALNVIAVERERKDAKKTIASDIADEIVAAPDITDVERKQIQDTMSGHLEVTKETRRAFERYKLRQVYSFGGPITKKFVLDYCSKDQRSAYRNLQAIGQDDSIELSLGKIQETQLQHHMAATDADNPMSYDKQMSDLSRRYDYSRHRVAAGILLKLGWFSIRDRHYVSEHSLFETLYTMPKAEYNEISNACVIMGMKTRPDSGIMRPEPPRIKLMMTNGTKQNIIAKEITAYVKYCMQVFTWVLTKMYKLKFVHNAKEGLYALAPIGAHFILDKDTKSDYRPSIFGTWKIPSGMIESE